MTLLGYSLIYKHKHVKGLVKGLADAIATLKPGDAIKLNFNMKELESHTNWHACVVDTLLIALPKAIIILLTQPWDKDKREWTITEDFSALIHQFQFNAAQQAAFIHLRALPTPSNDVVNDLAVGIKEAQLQFIPNHETIVVCYYVLSTEEDLLLMLVKKQRPHPANARPPIIAEDDSTCNDGLLTQVALAQMLFEFQQA
ncbi:hypothetical protein IFM61606_10717 [Aspergillus udagawae]|nr:hypothetical protein IFM61606_10717 [Aspergillus udagawae]